MRAAVEPNVIVIFGATGDLAARKLLPAIAKLGAQGRLDDKCLIVGVGRRDGFDDDAFRAIARQSLVAARLSPDVLAAWHDDRVFWHSMPTGDADDARGLGRRLAELESSRGIPANRTYYLSLPPTRFIPTIDALGAAGLSKSAGWTRVVVEKPFGHDLASAQQLNAAIHRWFDEGQIYRIDHYLGKETVQNLLVFRLANPIFEELWNRNHVESVQILVAEDLGVEDRAGYYETAGALRDMVQNHMTQLLTLVAMGVPAAVDADNIRYEKIKVLRSLSALGPDDVVLGQYGAGTVDGRGVPGYIAEKGVAPQSRTETYVSLRLGVDNWRWQGVPFVLRTGKRLKRRLTQIALTFRQPPVCMFQTMGSCLLHSNVLLITLQPDEGFDLHFDVKKPGEPFDLETLPLAFRYGDRFDALPDAYETLLLDVLVGDQTLFVHADEVEASWRHYAPVLEASERDVHLYPAGSWGPEAAERHFRRGAPEWLDRDRVSGALGQTTPPDVVG
ncbi:MAG: glucose-6-phosphate dehydrogenase [bacterium]